MFINLVESELRSIKSDIGRKRTIDESNAELQMMETEMSKPETKESEPVSTTLSLSTCNSCPSESLSTTLSTVSASLYQKEEQSNQNEVETRDWSQITEADLELKEFECPRCLDKFKSTSELFRHMRKKYDDPLVCQECKKVWKDMANMLSHSYLHRGLKPYKCPKCTFSTRTRFNLRVHFGSCARLQKFSYKRDGQRHPLKRRRLELSERRIGYKKNELSAEPKENEASDTCDSLVQIGNLLDDMSDANKCTDEAWDTIKGMLICEKEGKMMQDEYERLVKRLGHHQKEKLFKGLLRFSKVVKQRLAV